YRSWSIGEPTDDQPEVGIEVVLRIQRLASGPELATVLAALPPESPPIGTETLDRSGPTVEEAYANDLADRTLAIEVTYEGTYRLDEESLVKPELLDQHFGAMGGWVASTLVRLGDLRLDYLPPDPDDDHTTTDPFSLRVTTAVGTAADNR